jgi:4-amino-4-deoxy-L-arabinose transferase-like glycosyltransferase
MRLSKKLIEPLVLIVLSGMFISLVRSFACSTSATFDETAHLPAGYTYLRRHDYRLNPEHPPFVKKFAALPLLWSDPWPPALTGAVNEEQEWPPDSDNTIRAAWNAAPAQIEAQWVFGHEFLYGIKREAWARVIGSQGGKTAGALNLLGTVRLDQSDFYNNADTLLFRARMMIMILGLALLVLLYLWARAMFGVAGAVCASFLFCFDPNIIAHSGLVTTDMAETFFIFGAMFFLWRFWQRGHALNAVFFLACFALAFVTKFSAVVLLPICVTTGLILVFSRQSFSSSCITLTSKLSKLAAMFVLAAAAGLTTWLAIWACYSFRYSAVNEANPTPLPIESVLCRSAATTLQLKDWPAGVPLEEKPAFEARVKAAMEQAPLTLMGRTILLMRDHKILPEACLYGLAQAEMKSLLRGSFLFGEYSNIGFRSYFLWTFLLKTPIPALLAISASLVLALIRRPRGALSFVAVPVAIYLLTSIATHLNIGHRHILPVYPFLYLVCGGLGLAWQRLTTRPKIATAVAAVAAIVINSQFVFCPLLHPQLIALHYLAYMNEFAGGPRNGYKVLVDSNLDWGQDLKTLRSWLDAHHIEKPIWLSYFGMADPRYYGIRHFNVPLVLGGYPFESTEYEQLEREGRAGDAVQKFLGDLQAGQYVAVSATNLSGVYLGKPVHDSWEEIFKHCTFVDQVGYSILVYQVNGK